MENMKVIEGQSKVVSSLIEVYKSKSVKGLLPYEGQWLKYADIEQLLDEKSRRAKIVVAEILLLLLALFLTGLSFVLLVALLCY